MIPPLQPPLGLFPPTELPNYFHPSLPGWDGDYEIEEPRLVATGIVHRTPAVLPAATSPRPALPVSPVRIDPRPLGGKLTVAVCCYGDYPETHRQCLQSILQTVAAEVLDLRVVANACPPATLRYLESLPLTKLYVNHHNRGKYPAMRQLFHDPDCPLTTNYVAWFDDNTRVVHPHWLSLLTDEIRRQRADIGAYGPLMYYSLRLHKTRDPRKWLAAGPWWRGRPLCTQRGGEAPNGDTIHFVADWFCIFRSDAIRLADLPDPRLVQKGGDIVIGEQLHQNGWRLKQFNSGKNLVFTPPYAAGLKRGRPEPFPWQ